MHNLSQKSQPASMSGQRSAAADQAAFNSAGQSRHREFGVSHPVVSLRFARSTPLAAKNIALLTVEYPPAKNGGMGVVMGDIPPACNKHLGTDQRVVVMGWNRLFRSNQDPDKPVRTEQDILANGWQATGDEIQVEIPWVKQDKKGNYISSLSEKEKTPVLYKDNQATFKIYQKKITDPLKGDVWVYGVTSTTPLLMDMDDKSWKSVLDLDDIYKPYGRGVSSAAEQVIFLTGKAMAEAAKRLNPTYSYAGKEASRLERFDGPTDAWILNDWSTAGAAKEIPMDTGVAKISFFHNHNDKMVGNPKNAPLLQTLAEQGMAGLRKAIARDPRITEKTSNAEKAWEQKRLEADVLYDAARIQEAGFTPGNVSALKEVLDNSHLVMIDPHYYQTLTQTAFLDQVGMSGVKQALLRHRETMMPVHHMYSAQFDPTLSGSEKFKTGKSAQRLAERYHPLRKAGFGEQLQLLLTQGRWVSPERAAYERFKQENKLELQKLLNLKQDKDAMILVWPSRQDRNQKLFDLIMDELPDFLARNPKAQFVTLVGPDFSDCRIGQSLFLMKNRFPDRVGIVEKFDQNMEAFANAGASYSLMNSSYEPFGTSHLQAYLNYTPAIGHPVDGIRSTSNDPAVPLNGAEPSKRKGPDGNPLYPQTAVLMRPMEIEPLNAVVMKLRDLKEPARYEKFWQEIKTGIEKGTAKPKEAALYQTWQAARANFRQALDRAADLYLNRPDEYFAMAACARRYAQEQHSPQGITAAYYPAALNRAVTLAQDARRSSQTMEAQPVAASV